MKLLQNLLGSTATLLSKDAQRLWQKYHLRLKPRFLLAIGVLGVLGVARNLLVGVEVTTAIYLTVLLTLLAPLLVKINWRWFERFDQMLGPLVLIALVVQHFAWSGSGFSPVTAFYFVLIVSLASAGHIRMASLACLTCCIMLLLQFVQVPTRDEPFVKLLIASAATAVLLFVFSVVLWQREIRLCNRRGDLLSAIKVSITLRDQLLQRFLQGIQAPLERILQLIQQPAPNWTLVGELADSIKEELNSARTTTLELEAKLYFPDNPLEDELEVVSRGILKSLLHSAAIATGVILLLFVAGSVPVRWSLIGAVLFAFLLYRFADAMAVTLLRRRIAIYGFFVFLVWGCVTELVQAQPMYDVIYAYIFLYCAFNATKAIDGWLISIGSLVLIWLWYWMVPEVPQEVMILRSNLVTILLFLIAINLIRLRAFRQFLTEIIEQELQLAIERDRRHRLLVTLFHDVANPLHVIIGNADLANLGDVGDAEIQLIAKMGNVIGKQLEITRLLGSDDESSLQLPIETVPLAELLQTLQETFETRLADKHIHLVLPDSQAAIMVNPTVFAMSVMSNLLTNAIKFSPSNSTITITASPAAEIPSGSGQPSLGIHIHDQGPGIPQSVIDAVGANRAIQSTKGSAGELGHGQGLRLASMYMAKMQGALKFDQPGQVSIYVRLA
jgi:signal transduction histidine kinase